MEITFEENSLIFSLYIEDRTNHSSLIFSSVQYSQGLQMDENVLQSFLSLDCLRENEWGVIPWCLWKMCLFRSRMIDSIYSILCPSATELFINHSLQSRERERESEYTPRLDRRTTIRAQFFCTRRLSKAFFFSLQNMTIKRRIGWWWERKEEEEISGCTNNKRHSR